MKYHYEKMCAIRQPVLYLLNLFLFVLTGLVLLLAGSAIAQTRWIKFQGSPVLEPGPSGAFDDANINWYGVLFDEGIYKMWYTGQDTTDLFSSTLSFGYASSTDGTNWTKYSGNPVLSPGLPGSWEPKILEPIVIRMGDTLKMWYSGYNRDIGKGRIGYATSLDGINWDKYESNPVIDSGSTGEWDNGGLAPKSVIFDGTIYRMWYVGYDVLNWHRVGYATSPDGINWTKYDDPATTAPPFAESDPVLKPGLIGSWDYDDVFGGSVLFDGSIFHMWYGALELSTFTTRIGYATSPDGIHWKKYDDPTTTVPPFVESDPIFFPGPNGSWDDEGAGQPSVLFDGTTFHMWYIGLSGPNFRIGYATAPNDSIQYWFAHDILTLSPSEGSEKFPILANDIHPALMIQNIGWNDEVDFAVTCQIDSNGTAVYSSTRTIDTLASFEETTVVFEEWDNMGQHSYDATFFPQLPTDGNTSNDTLKTTIEISNLVDDFEAGMGKWYSETGWGLSAAFATSGANSLCNTISGNYENNQESWVEFNYSFDFSQLDAAHISYWTKHFIQPDFDFGYVEVSSDSGQTWYQLGEPYTGFKGIWEQHGRSLTDYCGQGFEDVRIRFRFVADASVGFPGWFIDDVEIYPYELETSVSQSIEKPLPQKYALLDNYPNPFNPSTSIGYELPTNSQVILTIFNLLGQEIRTLVNENKEAGHHTVHWDGKDNFGKKAVSGVYLYQINAGDFRYTKKMLLLQ